MSFWQRVSQVLFGPRHESQPISELCVMLNEAGQKFNDEDYSGAREILLKAVEFRPRIKDAATTDWILQRLEYSWLFQDRFRELITFFTDYINRYAGDLSAYRARGAGFWYLGELSDAVSDYSKALELNPVDLLSLSGRGQVLAELGKSYEALDDLDKALRLLDTSPKDDPVWAEWYRGTEAFVRRGRAVAYASSSQIRVAMNEFDASITLDPENAWAYFSRAEVYDRIGDRSRAMADYRTALLKTMPRLTPIQAERANARIRILSDPPVN